MKVWHKKPTTSFNWIFRVNCGYFKVYNKMKFNYLFGMFLY